MPVNWNLLNPNIAAQAQMVEVAHLDALRDGTNALVRRQALAGSAEGGNGHGGPRN